MALLAILTLLDFSLIKGEKRKAYFATVQVGLHRDLGPMQKVFEEVIARSSRTSGKKEISGAAGREKV